MKCGPLSSIDYANFTGAIYLELEVIANNPEIKSFSIEDFIQDWHDKILKKSGDKLTALTYVKFLPSAMKASMLGETQILKSLRKKGWSSDDLDDIEIAFSESDANVNKYVKSFTSESIKVDMEEAESDKRKRKVSKKTPATYGQIKQYIKSLKELFTRDRLFKKASIFSTTGSQALKNADGTYSREADPDKDFYYNFIGKIHDMLKGTDPKDLAIGDTKIRLKVTRRDQVFPDGKFDGRDVLEPDDRAFLSQTGPGKTARLKAFNEGLKVFVTDEAGNVLFFDEDYNIVDSSDEAGKPIYFGVPTVKKSGNTYTWEITNSQGEKETALQDPEFIAMSKAGSDEWVGLSKKQKEKRIKKVTKKQQADLKLMYDLRQKIQEDSSFAPVVTVGNAHLGVSPVSFEDYSAPVRSSDINKKQFATYFKAADQANEFYQELAGSEYLTIPGYGVSVQLHRDPLSSDHIENIIKLLTNDDIKHKGKKVPIGERVTLARELIFTSAPGLFIRAGKDGKLIIKIRNKEIDITTEDGQNEFRNFLNTQTFPSTGNKNLAAYWNIGLDPNKEVRLFTVDGNKLSIKKLTTLEFARQHTYHFVQLDDQGNIPLLNGYLEYGLTQEQIAEITPEVDEKEVIPTPEEVTEDIAATAEDVQEIEEKPKKKKKTKTPDKQIDDIDNEFDSIIPELDKKKGPVRWERWKPGYTNKALAALEWYSKNPLSKYFPLNKAMHVANSNAFATWKVNGITLWAGSDYSDLYHESWHGFSQFFLTPAEKKALYSQVAKTKAGEKAIRQYMKANNITDRSSLDQDQINYAVEELLAETFRKYMMSGGNANVILQYDSKFKQIFRKIFNFLKELFTGVSAYDTSDIQTINKVKELYDNLRFMDDDDLVKYDPSIMNVMSGMHRMNKGIVPFEENKENSITYDDSLKIVRAIDSVIHEVIRKQVQRTQDPRIAAAIYRNPIKVLPIAYAGVKKRFQERVDDLEAQLESADSKQKLVIENQLRVLNYALENFGEQTDWLQALQGQTNTGVVAYHINKSEHFNVEPVELSREELEQFQKDAGETIYDKAAEEFSVLDLANDEIKAIVKAGRKFDTDGNVETDELGFDKYVDFNKAFATIIRLTADYTEPVEFEQAFDEYINSSDKSSLWLQDVLDLLGLADNSETNSSFDLWTKFWQTFYKTVIPHYQINFTLSRERDSKTKALTGRTIMRVLPGRARAVWKKVEWEWKSQFNTTTTNKFIKMNKRRINVLDVPKLQKELEKRGGIRGNELFFMHAIGLNVTENKEQIIKPIIENVKFEWMWKKIVAYHNAGNEITNVIDLLDSTEVIAGKTYASEATNLDYIFEKEARYGGKYPSVAIANPMGDPVYEESQHSSLTRMAEAINKANSYYELIAMPHMKHLDSEINPAVKNGLVWLNSIFDMESDEKLKRQGIKMEVANVTGVQTIDDDSADYDYSTKTSQADYFTRLLADMYSFIKLGKTTGVTPADKGTIMSTGVNNIRTYDGKATKHLYVDSVDFLVNGQSSDLSEGEYQAFIILLPHMQSEIDRIKKAQAGELDAVPGYTIGENRSAESFHIFDGVFSDNTKKKMLALDMPLEEYLFTDDKAAEQLLEEMQKEFGGFIESEYESILDRMGALLYLDSDIRGTITKEANTKGIDINQILRGEVEAKLKKDLDSGKITQDEYQEKLKSTIPLRRAIMDDAVIKSYVTNMFIHNIENMFMVFGDLALFSDFFKRNPGANSTGYQFRIDDTAVRHINDRMIQDQGNGLYETTFRDIRFPDLDARPKFDGTLNTAVFDETTVPSGMFNEIGESFVKHYRGLGKSKVEAEKIVYGEKGSYDSKKKQWVPSKDGIVYPYFKMDEGDAQGWITFDAYKMMSILQGKWSDEQNKLYNQIVKGEVKLTVGQFLEYFPVRKYQYWGPLQSDKGVVIGFHKYSLAPLIPNAIDGTNMEILHDNMMQQNIDYGVHLSGSKVGTIINQERYDETGQMYDQLYENAEMRSIKKYNPEDQTTHYTKNTIFLPYLKDQLDINSHFKGKVIFSTQLRKLIENGIVENGVPIDFKQEITDKDQRVREWNKAYAKGETTPLYEKYRQHEKNVEKIIERRKRDLLERAGWTESDLKKGTGNLKSLLSVVTSEMERLEVGDHEIAFLDVDSSGDILHDLSLSPSADKIERVLTSIVNNQLIRQKVNGEPFVQMAATLWEHRGATEEEKAKYGQTGLRFYREEDSTIAGADIKLALHGEFKKLLSLRHADGKKIAVRDENGDILEAESLKRLNETINDEAWRSNKDNLAMITMVGVRIPVQGHNSMEFFHVKEFLPESAGNVIVPPSEIVAKSGSDFDIDKLSMIAPNIAVINGNPEIIRSIDESTVKSKDELKSELRVLKTKLRKVYAENRPKIEKIIEESDSDDIKEFYKKSKRKLEKLEAQVSDLAELYGKAEKIANSVRTASAIQKATELGKVYSKVFNEYMSLQDSLNTLDASIANIKSQAPELKKQIGDIERTLAGISSQATENELIMGMWDILSDPVNYIRLITPNSTAITQGKADQMRAFFEKNDIGYNPKLGWKKEKGGAAEKTDKISPTKALTPVHNNWIHEINSVGKEVLGIGAVDNTFNAILNRVGAHMNPFYGIELTEEEYEAGMTPIEVKAKLEDDLKKAEYVYNKIVKIDAKDHTAKDKAVMNHYKDEIEAIKKRLSGEIRIKIFMKHNKMYYGDQYVVSLSHLKDANNEHEIAEIISQLMNGWVDVAKGGWIFDVQGNKVVSPVLLYLIQAGVPFDTAVDFVSNPLVLKYVNEQIKVMSPTGKLVGVSAETYSRSRTQARNNILKLAGIADEVGKYDGKGAITTSGLFRYIHDILTEKKATKTFTPDKLKKTVKRDVTNEDAILGFLHYLELEEHAKGLQKLKTTMTYDTNKSTDLFQAAQSKAKTEALMHDTKLPRKVVQDILDETPIGAFAVQDFQLNLFQRLFPIRLHDSVNNFLIVKLSHFPTVEKMKDLFGTEEKYVRKWRNDLIPFIFANHFRRANADLNYYKGLNFTSLDEGTVSEDYIRRGVVVLEKDGQPVIHIDRNTLMSQFKNGLYTSQGYNSTLIAQAAQIDSYEAMGLAPVSTSAFHTYGKAMPDEYIKFAVEREVLRYMHGPEEVSKTYEFKKIHERLKKENEDLDLGKSDKELIKDAYEEWLRDTALDNIFNIYKMFSGASPKTVAMYFNDIVEDYPHLANEFSVVNDLVVDEGYGYVNLKLRDTKLTKDMINVYHENLRRLADPTVVKVTDPVENERISKFFSKLPMYSFLQSGLDTTSHLALTRIVPYDMLVHMLEASTKEALTTLNDPEAANKLLAKYTKKFNEYNQPNNKKRKRVLDLYAKDVWVEKVAVEDILVPVPGKENTYTVSIVNAEALSVSFDSFLEQVEDDYIVIMEGSAADKGMMVQGDHRSIRTNNVMTINTRESFDSKGEFTSKDPAKNNEIIDESLDKVAAMIAQTDKKVIFLSDGYGQYMIGSKNDEFRAKESFNHLSQQLYKMFGIVNPNSTYSKKMLETITGVKKLKTRDTQMEVDLNKRMSQEIDKIIEQMDSCSK